MIRRTIIFAALALTLVLPFWLRPRQTAATRADDTVVIITPHNEAIRREFAQGFQAWYRAQTGRTVRVDWRVVGGTSEIARYLEGAYVAAFENDWSGARHQPWNAAVQAGFQDAHLAPEAAPDVRRARDAFLASEVSSGIDVFFGGDAYQYGKEADAGHFVTTGLETTHPDWFRDDVMPARFAGEPFRDPQGRWFGAVLSTYGILYNRDNYRRLGLTAAPRQWSDLALPALAGEVALADPTKSGSVCEAFENIIQQQIQRQLIALTPATNASVAVENQAIREGWLAGLRTIQGIGANARYFTDNSQKPPIDVAAGDCSAGLCIDFYGRQQQEAVRIRGDENRLGYVNPPGGAAVSTDPIGLLRGAPHRAVGIAFIEFVLSPEGQKLWAFKPGTPGGPQHYALRRMPIRRDFYQHAEWKAFRSDPDDDPYDPADRFTYHAEWTGNLFREIGFVTRVMCLDSHAELAAAWKAIAGAPEPARSQALAVLQNLGPVAYDRVADQIHRRLNAKDRVEEVRLATELGAYFRSQYQQAEAIAQRRSMP